jgi:serine/threonine protein phosphatase 1
LGILRRLLGRGREAKPRFRALPGKRVYAIGDIHGRADLLAAMITLIATDLKEMPAAEALTILLGDYVDRGPNSREVLDRLIEGAFPTPVVALRGNHEMMALDFIKNPRSGESWRRFGGLETLHSYAVDVGDMQAGRGYEEVAARFREALPASHVRFIEATPSHFSMGDYFFCHAGVRPGLPLDRQREADLLWMREPFLSSRQDFGKLVVHGHTPVAEPDVRDNRINIDTGAYLSGRLTCLVIESEERRFLTAR